MENIDDLMRQKFDSDDPGERFEFQEEYWEQAKALLEKEDARRRRWLWLLIGLVLAVALGLWLLLGASGILSQKMGGAGNSTTTIDPRDKIEKPTDSGEKSGSGAQNIETLKSGGDTISENGQAIAPASKSSLSETPSQGLETTRSKRNTGEILTEKNSKGSAADIVSDAQKLASEDIKPRRDRSRNTKKGGNADKNLSETARNRKETAALQFPENGPASNGSNPSKASATPDQNAQEITTPPITNHQSTTPPTTNIQSTTPPITTPPITIPPTTNIPISQYPNIPTLNLPTPIGPLALPERTIMPRKRSKVEKPPVANNKKAPESQRLTLGVSLAGAAYQQSDSAGRWAGWALGGYGAYRLNKRISLMLGAQYRFVPGYGAPSDSSNPVEVTQLRYSFGYKSEVWKRETRGLHFLEIPISAHWNKGRWGAEGGLAAGVLLAVQNQTEYTEASSLEAPKTTVKKFVKGNTTPYNASYFSAFAGAEYHLNDWLAVTARAQYRFTPALKKAADGLKNSGIGNVELGLRVRLF